MRKIPVLLFLAACGRTGELVVPEPTTTTPPTPTAYVARDGLTVHEWGTFTSVIASDGTLLPGLHHEEEDLPSFVADRIAQSKWPSDIYPNEKMETPVTYFYASAPMQVSAKVHFPQGLLTQWFPYVKAMHPWIRYGNDDPWLSTSVSVQPDCAPQYADPFHDGLLDWGTFDVLGPAQSAPLASPLEDRMTWGFSRQVASNVVHMPAPMGQVDQYEKFLFYRGLGNFELPLGAQIGDQAAFSNRDGAHALGGLLFMRVTADAAGFVALGDLTPGQTLEHALPEATMSHDEFVRALKAQLQDELLRSGLYADEAAAMVNTWERSYFLTPGLRLLYLLPQERTDALIPLEISPTPVELKRTMVIRVELLTPDDEAALSKALLGRDAAFFIAKGRFAQPDLTRALQLVHDCGSVGWGNAQLDAIRAQRRWAPLAAE
jgi:hypothetical protein